MKTVVAFLDNYSQAEGLVHDLADRGFKRENIEIGRTAKGEAVKGKKREGFFAWLFGSSEEKHEGVRGYYPEGPHGEEAFVAISASEADALIAHEIMRSHGAVDIEERPEDWMESGRFFEKKATEGDISTMGAEEVVPVVEEEVRVGKREVPKGKVRVTSRVTETPVEEDIRLREEHATVERRPVDRPLSEADKEAAFRETSFEVRETAEEPVVSKEARVKEEVIIGKEETERTERIRETARRTDVDVEEEEFGRYYNQLKEDRRFKGRHWAEIEEDVRADWERDRPGTWNKYRENIRNRWEMRK
jgi:stress response protein YsnF